jgi:hypothetical protein
MSIGVGVDRVSLFNWLATEQSQVVSFRETTSNIHQHFILLNNATTLSLGTPEVWCRRTSDQISGFQIKLRRSLKQNHHWYLNSGHLMHSKQIRQTILEWVEALLRALTRSVKWIFQNFGCGLKTKKLKIYLNKELNSQVLKFALKNFESHPKATDFTVNNSSNMVAAFVNYYEH